MPRIKYDGENMSWTIKKLQPQGNIVVRIGVDDTKGKICSTYRVSLQDLKYNQWRAGAYLSITKTHTKIHIVRPLETLQSIAQKYNLTIEDLIAKNGLKNNCVFIGQQLILD